MNNKEKAAAAILRANGFLIFWQYSGEHRGDYWATHPKLICQYHLENSFDEAMSHLADKVLWKHADQLTLF